MEREARGRKPLIVTYYDEAGNVLESVAPTGDRFAFLASQYANGAKYGAVRVTLDIALQPVHSKRRAA